MSVTLINVFELPKDQRDEFLKRWTETTQSTRGRKGSLRRNFTRTPASEVRPSNLSTLRSGPQMKHSSRRTRITSPVRRA